ncbi:MAG: universal stress protein [Actinobacteria bacterium]|nr:MAG: universal stress protein [Actinomycetota bacterium]
MILIAYDGSKHGQRAIAVAAERLAGPALVVHVLSAAPRAPLATDAMTGAMLDEDAYAARERELRRRAENIAEEGARLARAAGLDAEALVVEESGHRIWRAIVDVAEERDATMIVLGHRGGSALRTSLPGSVSRAVVAHCDRPIVVVPCEREPPHYTSDAARKAFADVAEHSARDHHDELERMAHQEAARRAGLNPRRGIRL